MRTSILETVPYKNTRDKQKHATRRWCLAARTDTSRLRRG